MALPVVPVRGECGDETRDLILGCRAPRVNSEAIVGKTLSTRPFRC